MFDLKKHETLEEWCTLCSPFLLLIQPNCTCLPNQGVQSFCQKKKKKIVRGFEEAQTVSRKMRVDRRRVLNIARGQVLNIKSSKVLFFPESAIRGIKY